jgi:hypothetical protein
MKVKSRWTIWYKYGMLQDGEWKANSQCTPTHREERSACRNLEYNFKQAEKNCLLCLLIDDLIEYTASHCYGIFIFNHNHQNSTALPP